jgi:hypothetical protein
MKCITIIKHFAEELLFQESNLVFTFGKTVSNGIR